jgi:hypothetical protein
MFSRIMRRQLDEERNARRLLESRIFSWRQSWHDDATCRNDDADYATYNSNG